MCLPVYTRMVWVALGILLMAIPLSAAEPPAKFFRGINLNGPAIVIDGRQWEAGATPHLRSSDQAFENQAVPLIPSTDAARALMIRSSRWNTNADLHVVDVPNDSYSVFLYVWEDNNPETFSISLNGQVVQADFVSDSAGMWMKLGPWKVTVTDGSFHLTTTGGHANLSGLEIWRGAGAIPEPSPPPAPRPVDPVAARHFNQHIAPLLAKHCAECHGGSERKGDLSLTKEVGALAGGSSGPVLIPGKPDESSLIEMIESDAMPQKRPALSVEEKRILRTWVANGAKWGTTEVTPFLVSSERRAGLDWWSLRPVTSPLPPTVKNTAWVRNEVD